MQLIYLIIPLMLIAAARYIGRRIEKRHYIQLAAKEAQLRHLQVTNLKTLPETINAGKTFLVMGSVVIATDYFKVFSSIIRNLLGGEMESFQSLMERARREALVRMLERAQKKGASIVWNVRYETSTILGQKRNTAGGVEVLAYGTAVKVDG